MLMPKVLYLSDNRMFLCTGTQWLPETGDHRTTVGGVQQSEYSVDSMLVNIIITINILFFSMQLSRSKTKNLLTP